MIKIHVKPLSGKGRIAISDYLKNVKPMDRFFMRRMGTTAEVKEGALVVTLSQLNLKALAPLKQNKKMAEKYEKDLVKKTEKDYVKILGALGLKRDIDYNLNILGE